MNNKFSILILICSVFAISTHAQLSPGKLIEAHAHLEGLSNCTQCHLLGEKVTNEKCLDCHKEIQNLITNTRGYHSSNEVIGKDCFECHSDHHGRNFEVIRFDTLAFNHSLSSYELLGKHAKLNCKQCHKTSFIPDVEIKKREKTYLGLEKECLSCHTDFHQKTLSSNCTDCHDMNAFIPAARFNHNKSNFKLIEKHQNLKCVDCHKKEIRNGKDFQVFKGIKYSNCSSCHVDVHKNKFGQNCAECHTQSSFKIIKGIEKFDHSKTNYKLSGKHLQVKCKECHPASYTKTLKSNQCVDCHDDYHKNQFNKNNIKPDCIECHSLEGFSPSRFTIERHNEAQFKLDGSHLATPCFSCHKVNNEWTFKNIGIRCTDCHDNIHKAYINKKYFPEESCESCHSSNTWTEIRFEHNKTNFKLEGSHLNQSCRACHFKKMPNSEFKQQFSNLANSCENCHVDIHRQQFKNEDISLCKNCHGFTDWKPINFNHDKTNFKLDGEHKNVDCKKCHLDIVTELGVYKNYTFSDISCKSCH